MTTLETMRPDSQRPWHITAEILYRRYNKNVSLLEKAVGNANLTGATPFHPTAKKLAARNMARLIMSSNLPMPDFIPAIFTDYPLSTTMLAIFEQLIRKEE